MSKQPKVFTFKFDDEFIAEVEAWRDKQPIKPSRAGLFKQAVRQFIAADGAAKSRKGNKEGACK